MRYLLLVLSLTYNRHQIKLNPEDEKVFREPSFYAKMLNPNAGAEDSDEELEEDEKDNQKKTDKKKDEDEELEEEEEKGGKKEAEISTKKKQRSRDKLLRVVLQLCQILAHKNSYC